MQTTTSTHLRRLGVLTLAASLVLSLTPALVGTATARNPNNGGPNECRQQSNGNKDDTVQVACVVNVGDVSVTVVGDRSLNDLELSLIEAEIEDNLDNNEVCSNQGGHNDACIVDIVDDVTVLVGTFLDFDLFEVCGTKGNGKRKAKHCNH